MGYNIPTVTKERLSFGPGVLKLALAGITPTEEIGAVRSGAVLSIIRTPLDLLQGSPQTLKESYCIKEEVSLKVSGLEWYLPTLAKMLGAGEVTGTSVLEFGGDMGITNVALRFEHKTPSGQCIILDIFKARGSGALDITYGDDWHEFPYTFNALEALTDWTGATLADKKKMFKIEIV